MQVDASVLRRVEVLAIGGECDPVAVGPDPDSLQLLQAGEIPDSGRAVLPNGRSEGVIERHGDVEHRQLVGGDPANESSPAYWAAELNKAIGEAASRRGVPVADVATPFDDGKAFMWTYIANGDIHANNLGHQAIAEQFWQALKY